MEKPLTHNNRDSRPNAMDRPATKIKYKTCFKRLIDIIFSTTTILIATPIFIISAILIKVTSEGPVVFTQKRIGKSNRVFNIYKFRTMTNKPRMSAGEIFSDNIEVTWFGLWLRRTKIDELPQLFNVLIGDMSLVGPRPCLPELLDSIPAEYTIRFSERPGMTGLAQVNGNIYLPWAERWEYDKKYVEQLSFALDIRIIAKTILVIFFDEKVFAK